MPHDTMTNSPVEDLYGDPLDRLLSRMRSGDDSGADILAAEQPQWAGELRTALPVIKLLERAKQAYSSGRLEQSSSRGTAPPRQHVGEYELLGELGRGGMGIVYLARQASVGRLVAVKTLAAGPAADPRTVERFRRESQAAARLHHTHIVPVLDIGHDDGLEFFVMPYIAGCGLDAAIAAARQPALDSTPAGSEEATPEMKTAPTVKAPIVGAPIVGGESLRRQAAPLGRRKDSPPTALELDAGDLAAAAAHVIHDGQVVARQLADAVATTNPRRWNTIAGWGRQAALALAHAHAHGTLHRDVKPSNLLVDGEMNLWVSDFGLARRDDHEQLTQTGDVLGTLRYLAPEAFRGQWSPACDVYSLGLTLYELTALAPARPTQRRDELLKQVQHGDIVPLSRTGVDVPPDLETIIHKALAFDPAQRYATAQALADDLAAFVAGRPIGARRASWLHRGVHLAKRYPVPAASAAIVFTVAVAAFASVYVSRQRAIEHRESAEAALSLAKERAAADRRNFRWAMSVVGEYLTDVADDPSLRAASMEPLRAQLLEKARRFFDEFARQRSDEPELKAQRGQAYVQLARIADEMGEKPLALLRTAADTLAPQGDVTPTPDETAALADCWQLEGKIHFKLHDWAASKRAFDEALRWRRTIVATISSDAPTDQRRKLADLLAKQAMTLVKLKEWPAAESALDEAARALASIADSPAPHADDQETLASVWSKQAILFALTDRVELSQAAERKAIALREKLVAAYPQRAEFRDKLAGNYLNLAAAELESNHPTVAIPLLKKASETYAELRRTHPLVEIYGVNLAHTQRLLGKALAASGLHQDAIAAYRQAIALRQDHVQRSPKGTAHRNDLAKLWAELADLLVNAGRAADAETARQAAAATLAAKDTPPAAAQLLQ